MPSLVNESSPRRRPRVVGLIVLALCVVVLGFAIVSISVGTGTEGQIKITGAEETQSLLGGIQEDGARLGRPTPRCRSRSSTTCSAIRARTGTAT